MLRISFFLFLVILFSSCNKPTGIKELVSTADSVAINFFKGDGTMDTVMNVVVLHNKKQVDSLARYIESDRISNSLCGYDGSLHFFKNNMVFEDVYFRMNDANCMHFVFVLNGEGYSTKLSADAKQFLQSIRRTN